MRTSWPERCLPCEPPELRCKAVDGKFLILHFFVLQSLPRGLGKVLSCVGSLSSSVERNVVPSTPSTVPDVVGAATILLEASFGAHADVRASAHAYVYAASSCSCSHRTRGQCLPMRAVSIALLINSTAKAVFKQTSK